MCSNTRYLYDICMCISRHRLKLYFVLHSIGLKRKKRYLFVNDLITIIHTFRFYIVHTIIQWKIGKDETNSTRMATDCSICASVLSVLYAEAVHKLFGSFFSHLISVSVFCARAHLETLATIMVLSMGSCTYGRAAQNRVIIINCVCALVHTF